MLYPAIALAAMGLLAGLLWAEKGQASGRVLAFKAPLSCLFVLTALVQPHDAALYFWLVLAGLALGLAGDVLLALKAEPAFKIGLFSFLAGHVLYVVAFASLTSPGHWWGWPPAVICAVSAGVFIWLRPHIGAMFAPVTAYMAVISLMLAAAWAVLQAAANTGGWLVFIGALCFYLSDIFVARDRFVSRQYVNRIAGLPLYYAGQFLIAGSVGMVN